MKTKGKQLTAAEQAKLRLIVDEAGRLQKQLAPHKAAMAKLKTLEATLRAAFAKADPLTPMTAEGDYWIATLGAAGMQTHIESMQRVYETLGHKAFIENCSMTLEKLKAAADIGATEWLTVTEQTGPRSLLLTEREQVKRKAA